jgi:polysaccharide biosynthesis/export protein
MRFCLFSIVPGMLSVMCLLLSSCGTRPPTVDAATKVAPDVQTLNPGDVIKIEFPSAPTLNANQQIRRDGRINLQIIGEVKVSDKTPKELENHLLEAYSTQLQSKEITVTVLSSAYCVYVTGAVMKPGKINPERVLTAFDAVMEAGGLDPSRANPKKVRVIRQEDGQVKTYILNMKAVLDGKSSEPFYLKSYDTVSVPEKISWF